MPTINLKGRLEEDEKDSHKRYTRPEAGGRFIGMATGPARYARYILLAFIV